MFDKSKPKTGLDQWKSSRLNLEAGENVLEMSGTVLELLMKPSNPWKIGLKMQIMFAMKVKG